MSMMKLLRALIREELGRDLESPRPDQEQGSFESEECSYILRSNPGKD